MESRAAIVVSHIPHFVKQLVDISLVGCSRAGVARRVNTRRALQRIDCKPRVISDRSQARQLGSVVSLDQRVLDKVRASLIGIFNVEIRLRHNLDVEALENAGNFLQLAGVAAGHHYFCR